jgi:hypothetical protein
MPATLLAEQRALCRGAASHPAIIAGVTRQFYFWRFIWRLPLGNAGRCFVSAWFDLPICRVLGAGRTRLPGAGNTGRYR